MRKLFFVGALFLISHLTWSQLQSKSVNLRAGLSKNVYIGDLGNGFLDFNQKFASGWHLSVDYPWTLSYSVGFKMHGGQLIYRNFSDPEDKEQFQTKLRSYQALGSYKLNNGLFLPIDALIRVNLLHGIGVNRYTYEDGRSGGHLFLSAGVQLEREFNEELAFFYDMTHQWSMFGDIEGKAMPDGGVNDRYISHTVGVRYKLQALTDSDSDGLIDSEDACPDVYGLKAMDGCPDSDLDGVSDREDACIYEPGPVALGGCPDSDRDGLSDNIDRCPFQSGSKINQGCPDTDEDGLIDLVDKCPDRKGPKKYEGCPDSDGDKIPDHLDICPEIAGIKQMQGCPDTDRDGIRDSQDRCPLVSGPLEMEGCPDSDGDGVADVDDVCPSEYGVVYMDGCPDDGYYHMEELDKISRGIRFSGKSKKLLASSYQYLEKLYQFLLKYEDIRLRIKGHMDPAGDEQLNMIYSLERAGAVKDYLLSRGIPSYRLNSIGLGETMSDEAPLRGMTRLESCRRIELEVGY